MNSIIEDKDRWCICVYRRDHNLRCVMRSRLVYFAVGIHAVLFFMSHGSNLHCSKYPRMQRGRRARQKSAAVADLHWVVALAALEHLGGHPRGSANGRVELLLGQRLRMPSVGDDGLSHFQNGLWLLHMEGICWPRCWWLMRCGRIRICMFRPLHSSD